LKFHVLFAELAFFLRAACPFFDNLLVFLIPAISAKIPVPVHRRLLSMGERLTNVTLHIKILGKNNHQVKPATMRIVEAGGLSMYTWMAD
jgi:hypothetical protein